MRIIPNNSSAEQIAFLPTGALIDMARFAVHVLILPVLLSLAVALWIGDSKRESRPGVDLFCARK